MAFVLAGALGFGLWALALRSKWNPVLTFCLLGGALGSLTHVWAVRRGVLTKPPMLQGASPFAAVIFAFFEYIFYWCTILVFAKMIAWIEARLRRHRE
jgi:hypothetical protein